MSDDERARIRAATIEECAKVCDYYADDWNAKGNGRYDLMAEAGDRCADGIRDLAASPAPAIPMPPLNDAMRAVLTNENCIYGTPDELYAALGRAAPTISESDLLALLPDTTYMDEPDGGSPSLLEQLQRMAKDAARYRRLRDKHDGDGPAAAVRCLTGPFFNAAIHGERLDATIDTARKGEKS